jgi:hypothetical protein
VGAVAGGGVPVNGRAAAVRVGGTCTLVGGDGTAVGMEVGGRLVGGAGDGATGVSVDRAGATVGVGSGRTSADDAGVGDVVVVARGVEGPPEMLPGERLASTPASRVTASRRLIMPAPIQSRERSASGLGAGAGTGGIDSAVGKSTGRLSVLIRYANLSCLRPGICMVQHCGNSLAACAESCNLIVGDFLQYGNAQKGV